MTSYILSDDVQLGCKELRAKRFISDGFCTSLKAIKEAVCAGHCMPIKEQNMPWWAEFTKYWAKPKFKEWRCVEAVTKLKKVQLQCENGETRIYKIKIVKSCRCKSYEREPNRTEVKGNRGKRQNNKDKDRKDREKKRREREERKKLKREQRLTRKNDKSKGKVISSPEARRHRHNHKADDGGGRREIPSGKNTGISESQNSNSQIISNNESPSV